MRIAIVHYHMRPGGVTRVIENAISSLEASDCEFVVLTGEKCRDGSPVSDRAVVIEGLGYQKANTGLTPRELAGRMTAAAGAVDVWHFHNHSLGKNAILTDAVALLAQEGARMFLQIHDFAEDGRPSNFAVANRSETLYPAAAGVHYGALTGRDRNILAYAGVPEEKLHLLPNPVFVPHHHGATSGFATHDRILFYPTRGIRRKNIGEAVFLGAVLAGEGVRVATSRAPENVTWKPIHDRWKALSKECDLPVSLGVVDNSEHGGHSFGSWLASADAILTTSVAEGFGLAFLEPFLLGKQVVGRDLPDITGDFRRLGLPFPGLYRGLLLPEVWINLASVREKLSELLEAQYSKYGIRCPRNGVDRALAAMQPKSGWFDFGSLGESAQEAVIRHVVDRTEAVKDVRILGGDGEIAPAIPWMRKRIDMAGSPDGKTKSILEKHYSLGSYGHRLLACYESVASGSAGAFDVDSEKILSVFLAPERFHFLRTT